jgi:hypothetical protein
VDKIRKFFPYSGGVFIVFLLHPVNPISPRLKNLKEKLKRETRPALADCGTRQRGSRLTAQGPEAQSGRTKTEHGSRIKLAN